MTITIYLSTRCRIVIKAIQRLSIEHLILWVDPISKCSREIIMDELYRQILSLLWKLYRVKYFNQCTFTYLVMVTFLSWHRSLGAVYICVIEVFSHCLYDAIGGTLVDFIIWETIPLGVSDFIVNSYHATTSHHCIIQRSCSSLRWVSCERFLYRVELSGFIRREVQLSHCSLILCSYTAQR